MAAVLSQDEVNALLKGISGGKIETDQKVVDPKATKKFDFSSQDRIIRGRMPTLEIINERLSRSLRSSLSLSLGKMVDLVVASHKTLKFNDFMKSIPVPASFNILKFDPLRGHIMVVLDPNLVFVLVDMFFGGSGQTHVKVEGRDFTFIEQRIVKKIVEMIRVEMEKAWKPVVPIDLAFIRTEVNPQFASIVPPSEIVIVINIRVELESFSGDIWFCLPYSTLEPIKDKLYAGFQSEQLEIDHRWVARLKHAMEKTHVQLNVQLGKTTIKVKDVTNLKVGDVILLNTEVKDEMELKVEGVTKYYGRPGVYNGKAALKITRVFDGREKNG